MDVLAKHKIGSTPVLRSHELGLRRVGRLVKDEERRWGSEEPFPREVAPRVTGAHEGGVSASRTWQGASKIGSDASPGGSPRPGRSSPGGQPCAFAPPLRWPWRRSRVRARRASCHRIRQGLLDAALLIDATSMTRVERRHDFVIGGRRLSPPTRRPSHFEGNRLASCTLTAHCR
jgi:hypothetical protein